jgi:cytochrome c biogenesis protein CcmG/thiol:disulfide interchange protein DsbE
MNTQAMVETSSTTAASPIDDSESKRLRKRHLLITASFIVAAVLFVTVLVVGLGLDLSKVPPSQLEKPANDFRVAWLQGHEFAPNAKEGHFRLEDFRGKPLVLNFWASWCVSCREEAKELQAFWAKHQNDVVVVGIAIQDDPDAALKFAKYFGKTYILGLDEDGKAAIDYGVTGVPETFLIDKDGVIRHKETGPVDVAKLESLLGTIM